MIKLEKMCKFTLIPQHKCGIYMTWLLSWIIEYICTLTSLKFVVYIYTYIHIYNIYTYNIYNICDTLMLE